MSQNALIYFIKAPVLGKVKTRLAKSIGDELALALYEHFVRQLLQHHPKNCDIFIAYDDVGTSFKLPTYLENHTLFLQAKGDLGHKMYEAFLHVFNLGYTQALLVGSDIPEVNESVLEEATKLLNSSDAVLSPTFDGGYYLIGFHATSLKKVAFEGIVYGKNDVFKRTQERLHPLQVTHGKKLRDIDTLADVKAYAPHLLPKLPHISVIIPVYHEDETLLHTIETLRRNATHADFEIIVVDSLEKTTVERLPLEHVRIGFSPKGRASQMNEGARMAQGDILVFLHADTHLPKAWDTLIKKALHVKKAGAFSLGIDDAHYALRFIETMANFRTKTTQIPYGDQAHFFRAPFFTELGGYADIPLMEDIKMMKHIKNRGEKITLLHAKVLTSARRWHKEGIVYTTLRNRMLSFLYWCGVSPHHLTKRYKSHRN